MPPQIIEYAAKYASETPAEKATRRLIWSNNNPFYCLSKTIFLRGEKSWEDWKLPLEIFWLKNPNGLFQFGISFENQFQDQKDMCH